MPSPSKQAQRRALHYLRLARDAGVMPREDILCHYAMAAMQVEGYDPIVAEQAVARVWRDHFETQPPI